MKRFLFDDVERGKIKEEDLKLVEENIIKAIRRAQGEAGSKEKLENLLLGLLTPKEIEELAERIRIVELLKKGVSQHNIAGKLGVGVATVSRGAREIKEGKFMTI